MAPSLELTFGGSPTITGSTISGTAKQLASGENDLGTFSGSKTVDWSLGHYHLGTLNGNATLSFSNPTDRQRIFLELTQDATGSRTITWPTNVRWGNGSGATDSTTDKPTLTTTGNKCDLLTFVYDAGRNLYYGSAVFYKGAIT